MITNQIRMLRKQNQLTQAAFAEALGISRETVVAWENGRKRPNRSHLEKIAVRFGFMINFLLKPDTPRVSLQYPEYRKRISGKFSVNEFQQVEAWLERTIQAERVLIGGQENCGIHHAPFFSGGKSD